MSSLRGFLEWYLGVPPAGPGQGTAWRIVGRHAGPQGWPGWLTALGAVVLCAALIAIYARETRRLGRKRAAVLAVLRMSALGLIVTMATQVTLSIDRTGLPVVAVLIDDSASMGLPDGTQDADKGTPATRFDVARRLLVGSDEAFLRALSRRFRIRIYRFDGEVVEVVPDPTGDGIRDLAGAVRELRPAGTATKPAAAVRQVLRELRGMAPSAVIVLTDGVSTGGDGEALSAVGPFAAHNRVPLYPVGIGGGGPAADLDLFDLSADEIAFLGDPVEVVGRFRAFGFAGEEVKLELADRATGKQLAAEVAEGPEDGRPAQTRMTFSPEVEGDMEIVLSLRAGGREADGTNNSLTRRVRVRSERIRVLLADRAPRYEFRHLKAALERDPTVDLTTFLQQADLGFSAEDRTALERFPLRREEIHEFDVIIFGDLDPGLIGAESMAAVAEFVKERGGGLMGIAGPEFFPEQYGGTPLEELLPVSPAYVSVPTRDSVLVEEFRISQTLAGRQSGPLARFGGEQEAGTDLGNLPGLYWRADPAMTRPGAVTVLETAGHDGAPRPVVVFHRFGNGKVLLQLTDETWRWRYRRGDSVYGRYWLSAIRYLGRGGLLGRDNAVELATDRKVYGQGDRVTLRARFLDDSALPRGGAVTVVVDNGGGGRREVELKPIGEFAESFEANIGQLPRGSYHAWIREPAFSGAPPSTDFRVEPPDIEFRSRDADLADLRRAAELSGGRFSTPRDAVLLPRQLPAGRPVRVESSEPRPLWNRPELLMMLVVVLAGEWWLRKRARHV